MKFALFGVAAVTAIGLVTPVKAQEVIYNPGYCAQFYPNANCQNLGPGNPYTDGGYGYRQNDWQNSHASMQPQPRAHRRYRTHRG